MHNSASGRQSSRHLLAGWATAATRLRTEEPQSCISGDGRLVQMEFSVPLWYTKAWDRPKGNLRGTTAEGYGCPRPMGRGVPQHAFLRGVVHYCWVRELVPPVPQATKATKQHSSGCLPLTPHSNHLCNWWHQAQNDFTEDSKADSEGESLFPIQWSECKRAS